MWLMLTVALADCELLKVAAPDTTVLHPFGDAWVPVASLVRPVGNCEGGQQVELISPVVQYQEHGKPHAEIGDRACLPFQALASLDGHLFLDQETGTVDSCCECARSPDRPVTPEQLGAIHRVATVYEALWGELNLAWVRVTEWGKVGLPLEWHGAAQIAAEQEREQLDTPERKEKAVVAHGGNYLHFLGTDAPYNDIWGQEHFIIKLMHVAHEWAQACPSSSEVCVVQYGDISWYNGHTPDPLGHADHWPGTCVDIRLFRKDASRYEAWWNQADDRPGDWLGYDGPTTRAFTAWLVTEHSPIKLFFNDPEDHRAGRWRGHDDHIHYCL